MNIGDMEQTTNLIKFVQIEQHLFLRKRMSKLWRIKFPRRNPEEEKRISQVFVLLRIKFSNDADIPKKIKKKKNWCRHKK